jgi:uncharacterized protein YyaL (SSP411 family)
MQGNGHILHRYRDSEAAVKGFLNDYAFFVLGLLEIYGAGFEQRFLQEAVRINRLMLDLFWDKSNGGFFLTANDGEPLLIRPKEIYDGALPSGNSIGLTNLLRLEQLTGSSESGIKAQETIGAFAGQLKEVPGGYTQFLSGLSAALSPSTEIVIVGNPHEEDTRKMLALINQTFLPNTATLLKDPGTDNKILTKLAPYTANYSVKNDRATAYVCRNHVCKSPTNDPDQLMNFLHD